MLQEEFAACVAGSLSYDQISAVSDCAVIDGSG